jgi:protein FrlC
MKQKIFDRLAAMDVQYVQYSLDYTIDSFKRCGLHFIEFWGATPHYYRFDYSTAVEAHERLTQIRKQLEENEISVIMYTPETLGYPYSFSHPDQRVRDRTVAFFDLACQDSVSLGCKQIFLNTGCGLRDLPREESWARTADSYRKICDIAKGYGIDMVLEQLQPYESNLVITLPDVKRMLEDVDRPNLKVCLDLTAMEVAGEKIEDYFETFGDKVAHIHLADENHQILGTGSYPVDDYMQYLVDIDFKGYTSLEINDSIYWLDPHQSMMDTMEYIRAWAAK